MVVDKKITQLPALPGNVSVTDIFLAVSAGTDYQLTGQQLIDFVNLLVDRGSVVTFNNTVPANTSGNDGDVVIRPASGQFYQRTAGVWVLKYTAPSAIPGNTIFYGSTAPNPVTGIAGDTYIETSGGIFYKKDAVNGWQVVFTMATGPAGADGVDGVDGAAGVNGKTILNGSGAPSNGVGTNGDYYIDNVAKVLYGPKASGAWPAGFSLIQQGQAFSMGFFYDVGDSRFVYNPTTMDLTFSLGAAEQLIFPLDPANIYNTLKAKLRQQLSAYTFKDKNTFDPIYTNDGINNISVLFEGVDADLLATCQIILS